MNVISHIFFNILKTIVASIAITILCGLLAADALGNEFVLFILLFIILGGFISFIINAFLFAPLLTFCYNYFKDKSKEEIFVSTSFILIIPIAIYFLIMSDIYRKNNFEEISNAMGGCLYFLLVNGVSLYFLIQSIFFKTDGTEQIINNEKTENHEPLNEVIE